ncbi:MBL fold metallo-hydrolase [Archaeoglobus neptunius]|uniref:MBL fold metallo-hydrolase n=1 Tax=Archaeoglobus neptunius TaxID=2798580 RepID=UPI001925B619|nr:MBL fold metallo-hydrolase [Archaeoglobus neptunius]
MHGEFVEVAENVYAYIQGRGEWFVSNSGLIIGDRYAVLIDSLANESKTRSMIEKIEEITTMPIKLLVNTHGHPDHVWTNHMFDAITICQENARKETMNAFVEIYQSLFPDLDFSGAKITPQDVTFRESLSINAGTQILLRYSGVAHTTGDCYVYLPEKKVVFCGDLLFAKPCTPLALAGSVKGYINALEELLKLDADVYIPGHGGIAGKEEVEIEKRYLEFVYEETRKGMVRGLGVDEIVENIDLGEFSEWNEVERIYANVARAYRDIKGEDMQFQEILEVAKKMLGKRLR